MTDAVFDKLSTAALGALDDYMAYRTYMGSDEKYYKRARLGIPVLSTYGRVRGTRANEKQLEIIGQRYASGEMMLQQPPPLDIQSGQGVTARSTPLEVGHDVSRTSTARVAARK